MPEPITEQGDRVLSLWQGSWVAAFAVGLLVWGLIVWTVIFHRKRSERLPPQVRYNLPIEALYTVLPLVIVAVLFYFTERDQTYLMATDASDDDEVVTVDVLAYQWSWQFTYAGEENVAGEEIAISGRPGDDPELVIPSGTTIHFNLESPDVIHSFWIPAFLFKLDVVPGHPNEFQVQVHEGVEGVFEGRCAELCGVYHSEMLFSVNVVSPEEFEAWMDEQRADPESGETQPLPEDLEDELVDEEAATS